MYKTPLVINVKIIIIIGFTMSLSKAQTSDLSFLKDKKDDYKFYFSGENHSHTNYTNRYELLTTLYVNNNVRTLVLEAPQEYEFYFNQYITTADTDTYYLTIFHKYTFMRTPEEFDNYLKKIKQFNEAIKDSSQKITIICADRISSLPSGMYRFSFIYQDGNTNNKALLKYIEKAGRIGMKSNARKNSKRKIRVVYKLKSLLDANEQDWKDLYLDNFNMAKRAINSLYRHAKVYNEHKVMSGPDREKMIYQNILEAYNENPNVSYYGNFGQAHTLLNCNPSIIINNPFNFTSSMANELNKTAGLVNKVFSMPYYYLGMSKTFTVDEVTYTNKDYLTPEEKEKYQKQFDKEGKFIYVPLNQLKKKDELQNMFHYLIISK